MLYKKKWESFETQIGDKFKVPMGCKTAEDNPQTKSNDIRHLFQAQISRRNKINTTSHTKHKD